MLVVHKYNICHISLCVHKETLTGKDLILCFSSVIQFSLSLLLAMLCGSVMFYTCTFHTSLVCYLPNVKLEDLIKPFW